MKATWLMALVSYAATVFSIWWICMQSVLNGVTLQGMELSNSTYFYCWRWNNFQKGMTWKKYFVQGNLRG